MFGAQDNRLGLLDWQLTLRSSWARDVSYIMATVTHTNISCLCCSDHPTIPSYIPFLVLARLSDHLKKFVLKKIVRAGRR